MKLTISTVVAITLLLGAISHAASSTTKPNTLVDQASCVTLECHANIKSSPILHGPVGANTCDACHDTVDVQAHTYKLSRKNAELCTYCHEFDVSAMPVIHKPVKDGQCLGCHDPHGGATRTLTREKTMAELCGRCHESVTRDHKFNHTPVLKGQCDSCHPPHAAMFPKLVDAVGTDLCLACHTEFDARLAKAPVRHKAMEDGCLECHDAHGSNQPMQVTKNTTELCLGCHEETKTAIAAATYKHSATTSDRACLNCHTPHGGNTVKLMLDQPEKVCMNCHKDPIKTANNRTIPAASELTDSAMHKHGAIKDGQCSGCHAAHGSDQPVLLTKPYVTTIYQAFSTESYALCFSCHDPRLVQQESAGTFTNFRNGDRNLHWVHVKEGQRGRACAVCHTTHASVNAKNVRDTSPFKIWQMPLRFSKTDTGGTCSPGCHASWAYDRASPVARPTTGPSQQPSAAAIARAEVDQPVRVTLAAKDIAGAAVQVPDEKRPTVLLMLGPDQARDEKLIQSITTTLTDPGKAKIVAIICGESTAKLPWQTIADPQCTASAQLDVRGWPTALVIRSDGLQVARIGGSTESFLLKLAPYIDVAAKKSDRAQADARIARIELINDGPSGIPSRNLQLARQLNEAGKPVEALDLLIEAMKLQPNSIPLQVEMIRTLADLKRGGDAMGMLGRIQPTSLPAGQYDVLRARVLIAMNRAPDASALLTNVLAIHPDLLEAHHLMGVIYEQQGDWKDAAAEYRAASGR
jgi:predicted CXXCH cytochrome family protein